MQETAQGEMRWISFSVTGHLDQAEGVQGKVAKRTPDVSEARVVLRCDEVLRRPRERGTASSS